MGLDSVVSGAIYSALLVHDYMRGHETDAETSFATCPDSDFLLVLLDEALQCGGNFLRSLHNQR